VHSNGVQKAHIKYCACPDTPSDIEQLCHACLFPATVKQPKTVFTFAALKEFHAHTLASKKSAYDHYKALQCQMDAAFPSNVPVS